MHATLAQCVGLLLLGAGPVYDPATGTLETDWTVRVQQLEAETQALRTELQSLRAQQPSLVEAPVAPPVANELAPALTDPVPPAMAGPSMAQVQAEIKKNAWKKGDFKITPYGTLWATMTYETEQTNNGNYVYYVYPKNLEGDDAFHADARSTRLGVDVLGPRVPILGCAQSGGKVEIDFQRTIDGENKPSILLRHAYVEVKNEEFRLLFGQTWDVISPLFPGVLMYTVGWGGGNIGYRRAQFRAERYLAFSDVTLVTIQGSLNTDAISDSATNLDGDHAGWPVIEGRIGTTLGQRGPGCLPIDFGVSGHIGEQFFDFNSPWPNPAKDVGCRTWSVNGDVRIPITHRFGVMGEFFTGENLGTFQGGILQGVDIGTTTTPGTRRPIRSTGGWVDVWYDWTPRLHNHNGWGIDDPLNQDITVGRTYNSFIFTNLSYDLTAKFLVGVEVSYWKTFWKTEDPGKSLNTALVAKYNF